MVVLTASGAFFTVLAVLLAVAELQLAQRHLPLGFRKAHNENAGAAATLLRAIEIKTRNQISKTSALSRRETEVLRLVAQGMSNQAIADRLALSKHTVHRHVSSKLTKLDLRSRAAAAAYAAQHELL